MKVGERAKGDIVGGYTDKLSKRAEEFMRPGEKMVSAIRTQPSGSTVGMAVGGIIGATIADKKASKARAASGEGSMAANWAKGRFAVGLTDQRLLTFNYTALGKPKDLTSETPIDQVSSVAMEPKKIMKGVRFTFTDGSSAEVECAKLEKVEDFVSAFQSVKAGS
ncbi:MAG: hypothetical protein QOG54_840 [Actinomycetota bacterium]|jgi:hypothetical protein|nr:hypothetical protein [Actinomycetota bacterium]